MSDEKRDICKICGKAVGYYKIDKGNGKSTHRAFHDGDAVPENAVEVSKYSVSSTYRNRMRQAFKHTGVVSPTPIPDRGTSPEVLENEPIEIVEGSEFSEPSPVEVSSPTGVGLLTGIIPDDGIPLKGKEKVVIKKDLVEVHEFPKGSEGKPEIDVSEIKRNRFAVVSAITRKLAELGKPEEEVNEIRSALVARGGDFPGIVNMASEHLRFSENGHPLFFRQ